MRKFKNLEEGFLEKEYKLDRQSIEPLMECLKSVTETIGYAASDIAKNGIYTGTIISELKNHLEKLECIISVEKPYLNGIYNPNYGDSRVCKCGHAYSRHFDPYEGMDPVGCKYCGCEKFTEE